MFNASHACWITLHAFCNLLIYSSKLYRFENYFRNIFRVSKSLEQDEALKLQRCVKARKHYEINTFMVIL